MNREAAILVRALDAVQLRMPLIARHVIKARVGNLPARREQLDEAINNARALHDELVTARASLGWLKREGDAA